MDFISILSIFVLACFVGYYVVWSVTPALHTPLMAVTNAISSVIIVGALIASAAGALSTPAKVVAATSAPVAVDKDITPTGIAVAEKVVVAPAVPTPSSAGHSLSKWLGLIAVALASVNIFGGFAVTERMLAMYKKKDRPAAAK
jgi:NAD(P) transhydrogenase subunit alpha